MNIFILNNDEPHYSISLCFSCGFFTFEFGKKSFNVWWMPQKCLLGEL